MRSNACGSALDPKHPLYVMTLTRSPSDLDRLRVLVVEDSWEISTGLQILLEASGATVVGPVSTTADAKRLISEDTPDAAIVDINLRDGELSYDLIDQLHDLGVRVVVLTGYADVSVAQGKVAAILQKPVRGELLIASLRERRVE